MTGARVQNQGFNARRLAFLPVLLRMKHAALTQVDVRKAAGNRGRTNEPSVAVDIVSMRRYPSSDTAGNRKQSRVQAGRLKAKLADSPRSSSGLTYPRLLSGQELQTVFRRQSSSLGISSLRITIKIH